MAGYELALPAWCDRLLQKGIPLVGSIFSHVIRSDLPQKVDRKWTAGLTAGKIASLVQSGEAVARDTLSE